MTFRDIIKQAYRKMGFSEDEIVASLQHASMFFPDAKVDEPLKFKPGKNPDEMVNAIIGVLTKIDRIALRRYMLEKETKIMRNN